MWVGNSVTALDPGARLVAGARWDDSLKELLPGLLVPNLIPKTAQSRAGLLPKFLILSKTVSHQSALWIYAGGTCPRNIHVIGTCRAEDSVVLGHRLKLRPDEVTWISGLRVTTPERTLLDVLLSDQQAEIPEKFLKSLNPQLVSRQINRASGRPGIHQAARRAGELVFA